MKILAGGTRVTKWENAELTMLLHRLRNDTIPQAMKDGYLVIGPETTQDVMTNPIVAKVYTTSCDALHLAATIRPISWTYHPTRASRNVPVSDH